MLGNAPPVHSQNLTRRAGQRNPPFNGIDRPVFHSKNRSDNRLVAGSGQPIGLIAIPPPHDDVINLAVVSNQIHENIELGISTCVACKVIGYRHRQLTQGTACNCHGAVLTKGNRAIRSNEVFPINAVGLLRQSGYLHQQNIGRLHHIGRGYG